MSVASRILAKITEYQGFSPFKGDAYDPEMELEEEIQKLVDEEICGSLAAFKEQQDY